MHSLTKICQVIGYTRAAKKAPAKSLMFQGVSASHTNAVSGKPAYAPPAAPKAKPIKPIAKPATKPKPPQPYMQFNKASQVKPNIFSGLIRAAMR